MEGSEVEFSSNRSSNGDSICEITTFPKRNVKPGIWKKFAFFTFLFILLCSSFGLGIVIGKFVLLPPVEEAPPQLCDKLGPPLHINRSTSYCEDPMAGNISLALAVIGDLPISSKCYLECEEGYNLHGPAEIECMQNGSWTHGYLPCRSNGSTVCPAFELEKGTKSCSNENLVGSMCKFRCDEDLRLVGSGQTACLPSLSWSNPVPLCVPTSCPECTTGPTCQYTTKFSYLVEQVPTHPQSNKIINYAGYDIRCKVNHHGSSLLRWDCDCFDVITNRDRKCHDFEREQEACSHALANLIKTMSSEGYYPEPCDPETWSKYLPCK